LKKTYYDNFNINQYEDIAEEGEFPSALNARYIEQEEPTYQNNVLIEALPPIMNREKVFKLIEKGPIYSEWERERDSLYRMHATNRLDDYIFPFSKHFEIEQNIGIALRRGYVNKKIFSPEHISSLRSLSKEIKSSKGGISEFRDSVIKCTNETQSVNGFSIFGVSGGGKSTAVDKILSFYPQHIVHITDGKNQILFNQLTWLKIDCSHDGSIKGLCQKFFMNVDHVLGTDYYKKYGGNKNSLEHMIVDIALIVEKHGLGLLVIDEIQHLRTLKKEGNEKALNFFVTMMNDIKLPIVYIGTYKAIELLSNDFRHTRRITGTGLIEMNFLEKDEFDLFIEDLWKFQWTKNKCKLTDSLKQTMYDCTMGIPDIVKKLYKVVQIEAIRSDSETITESLIKRMLAEKFPFVKTAVDKIKAGKVNEIYDDLRSPNLLTEFVENSAIEVRNREEARKIIESQERKDRLNEKDVISDLCIFMEGVGHKYSNVEKIAKRVVKKYGAGKEMTLLRNELIKEIYQNSLPSKTDIEANDKKTNGKNTNKTTRSKKSDLVSEVSVEEFIKENTKAYNS
jgi:hypothetical protein